MLTPQILGDIGNNSELRSLIEYAELVGEAYLKTNHLIHKKELGQFFTPASVAKYMAQMFIPRSGFVKILDPGAGAGILSCASLQYLAESTVKPQKIELTTYEIDSQIIPYLELSLDHAKSWLNERGIDFIYFLRSKDFILDNKNTLNQNLSLFNEQNATIEEYDYIICNPPYFKLQRSDPQSVAASCIVHGQPNIYALFMYTSSLLLKNQGEMVFIIPRSFTSGQYFRLFREKFFKQVNPYMIHLFESRKDTFNKDEVLQENIILKALKKTKNSANHPVILSYSKGVADLSMAISKKIELSEIIDEGKNKVMRLPLTVADKNLITKIKKWRHTLRALGMNVSTGPIVAFRARDLLSNNEKENNLPLMWMQNIKPMNITWPLEIDKPQYVKEHSKSQKLLVSRRNYVVLRRFSTKEEKKRLIAAPLLADKFFHSKLGFENHLNYIYKVDGDLSKEEVYGLSALLNSFAIDSYFRLSSGNTQVNASELRDLPLPPLETIRKLGKEVMISTLEAEEIDHAVEKIITME